MSRIWSLWFNSFDSIWFYRFFSFRNFYRFLFFSHFFRNLRFSFHFQKLNELFIYIRSLFCIRFNHFYSFISFFLILFRNMPFFHSIHFNLNSLLILRFPKIHFLSNFSLFHFRDFIIFLFKNIFSSTFLIINQINIIFLYKRRSRQTLSNLNLLIQHLNSIKIFIFLLFFHNFRNFSLKKILWFYESIDFFTLLLLHQKIRFSGLYKRSLNLLSISH